MDTAERSSGSDERGGADSDPEGPGRGRFVVLEGVEGSGKSTQALRLSAWVRMGHREVVTVREPGGTPVGEAIRAHLWVRPELEIAGLPELFLLSAARASLVRDLIRPALERGAWVVADRFALSTRAYQGYGRGLDQDVIARVTDVATAGLEPDLTILLDVDSETGRDRQRAAGKTADRIEREAAAFMERVAVGYRTLAAGDPSIEVVDGNGSEDEVEARVRAAVSARLGDARRSG